ncbi:hypothetical protein Q1695_004523 [Nippostrongylus brasiliensis]|nr:hypothetical protein Q1695_004523 [Nippostrongylus brasiliensis]
MDTDDVGSSSPQDQSSGKASEPNSKRRRNLSEAESGEDEGSSKETGRRPPFTRSHTIQRTGGKFHLLLAVTGSVAVIKLDELIKKLHESCPPNKLIIKVAATKSALTLLDTQDFEIDEIIYDDRDEWSMWRNRGDAVLHIELRKWADAMLIAPLDANSLAKIAVGICDNLVTSIVRAWDPRKPLYFAPAMNTMMWENPLTFQHRNTLKDLLRYKEIPPMEKELMCGDTGMGAMASTQMIATILATVVRNRFAVYTPVESDPVE